jgi:ligand-binding sensor domain-containing protein
VFRSDDDGRRWIEVNNGLRDLGVVDMAINDQGHVFVGTYLSTVSRSTDSGKTWQLTSRGIPSGTWVTSLVATTSHVFAAVSEAGIYRSADNGESWQPVNTGLDANRNYQALAVGSRNELFVANTRGDVFRSNDFGDSWKSLPAQSPIDDPPAALAVDSAGRLYYGAVVKGLFRYSVQRQDWELLNHGMGNSTVRSVLVIDGAMFVGTSGAADYAKFRGEDVYQSVDEGMTWSLVNAGLKHPRLKALAVNSKGLIFAGTWGGGVYRSVRPVRR